MYSQPLQGDPRWAPFGFLSCRGRPPLRRARWQGSRQRARGGRAQTDGVAATSPKSARSLIAEHQRYLITSAAAINPNNAATASQSHCPGVRRRRFLPPLRVPRTAERRYPHQPRINHAPASVYRSENLWNTPGMRIAGNPHHETRRSRNRHHPRQRRHTTGSRPREPDHDLPRAPHPRHGIERLRTRHASRRPRISAGLPRGAARHAALRSPCPCPIPRGLRFDDALAGQKRGAVVTGYGRVDRL